MEKSMNKYKEELEEARLAARSVEYVAWSATGSAEYAAWSAEYAADSAAELAGSAAGSAELDYQISKVLELL